MLRIREEQYAALHETVMEPFDVEMAAHLRKHFAAQTASLDDAALLELARESRRHAWRYGVDDHAALCAFIDVRVSLGPDFDTNPEYASIAEPLTAPGPDDGNTRVEEMFARAVELLSAREQASKRA